ncbi:phosphorylase family protein, partial [Streptomyces chryseus]
MGPPDPTDAATGPPSARPAPLLIACALGIEQFALRSGHGKDAPESVTVLRTGMGPKAAAAAVRGALGEGSPIPDAAVIASGFCAGLVPGMHPGDLIVADETRGPHGSSACTSVELLAKALSRAAPGRTVHT